MKRPILGFILAAASVSVATVGVLRVAQPPAPQRLAASTEPNAQQVVGIVDFRINGDTYTPTNFDFVRSWIPATGDGATPQWARVCTCRSRAANVVRCYGFSQVNQDDGFVIVPVFRDDHPLFVEIRFCREGDGIPGNCAIIVPSVQVDTLPTWRYGGPAPAKRRAVR